MSADVQEMLEVLEAGDGSMSSIREQRLMKCIW